MSSDERKAIPPATCPDEPEPEPVLATLVDLLHSERNRALEERADLVSKSDPGRLWLLWFAIGATLEICSLLGRDADAERNALFRRLADLVFHQGVQSECDPILADPRLIDLFESAGAAAVRACMRGEACLGYYLAALRVSVDRGLPPLLN